MDPFESITATLRSSGPAAVFDRLATAAHERKNYRELFSIRQMHARHRLGLPLIETEPASSLAGEQRSAYETALRNAARETGELFLADGDIVAAWPYFRAIGEPGPVAAAIEKVQPGEHMEAVISIAFQEEVNQRKGFELILEHLGICRAITCYGAVRDTDMRKQCLTLLVRTLYAELAASLKRTITANEPAEPATNSIAELISGRDWLFEGASYYVDTSHLVSLLRYSPELEDPGLMRMALDLADYGNRLDPLYHFRGDPPFDDPYTDHAVYLRILLGEDVESGLAHFRAKGGFAAEVLIDLFVRLGRYQEAICAAVELASPDSPAPPESLSVLQLCQMAGDYPRMQQLARDRGDVLAFAAGVVQQEGAASPGNR